LLNNYYFANFFFFLLQNLVGSRGVCSFDGGGLPIRQLGAIRVEVAVLHGKTFFRGKANNEQEQEKGENPPGFKKGKIYKS